MRAAVAAALLGIMVPGDVMPPAQHQGATSALVITTSTQAEGDEACGKAEPPKRIVACAKAGPGGQPLVVVPNPCRFANQFPDEELYAVLLCHELAHAQGWRHKK